MYIHEITQCGVVFTFVVCAGECWWLVCVRLVRQPKPCEPIQGDGLLTTPFRVALRPSRYEQSVGVPGACTQIWFSRAIAGMRDHTVFYIYMYSQRLLCLIVDAAAEQKANPCRWRYDGACQW
jgi:hypothetical protein